MRQKLLTETEVAALFALYYAAGASYHAHVPRQAVLCRFRKDYRGYVAEALDSLSSHSLGFVVKHPTRNEMTYQITQAGAAKLQELRLL